MRTDSVERLVGALLLVFLGSSFVGYLFAYQEPTTSLRIVQRIAERMGSIPHSGFHTFIRIFLNNSGVALISVLSGLFFGLGPWIIVAFNGFIAGLVVGFVTETGRLSLTRALLGVVPHGVIEIPALALAGAAGIIWYRELVNGEGVPAERFKKGMARALTLFAVSLLLLLVAAFIEAYITPRIAGFD